jgi:hypothetical protein
MSITGLFIPGHAVFISLTGTPATIAVKTGRSTERRLGARLLLKMFSSLGE